MLGIDPGIATTGWAIIESGENIKTIAYGHIETSPKVLNAFRLQEICFDLEKICDLYQPQETAIEKLFFFKNQKTIIPVAQSRGAILLTLVRKGITIAEYTPLQIKQALTGYGRADKKQMQEMVKSILHLPTIPKPDDTADALAIAICHLNSRKTLQIQL
ncbi:MAG: crossover junction endodeoxyribonuclease RuvC [Candidatus Moranbacteria bacterium]|nr:crossover junction endodeoxyribonuclease RuvC [Candidatus Moranbacteria bacterium]